MSNINIPDVPDAIVLEFIVENARTTALREPGATAPRYMIRRSHDLKTKQLHEGGADAGGAPIAELVFPTFLRDTVALRGEPTTHISKWLHSRKHFPVSFEAGGVRYVWTREPHDLWIALAPAHGGAPVACWEREGYVCGAPQRVSLARAVAHVHADVLAALLVLLEDAKVRGVTGVPLFGGATPTWVRL